ncbi:hypothetical protein [Kitasatospora sp. NPDC059673]
MAVPEPLTGGPTLPATKRLTTASTCLIGQLPQNDSRFAARQSAPAA